MVRGKWKVVSTFLKDHASIIYYYQHRVVGYTIKFFIGIPHNSINIYSADKLTKTQIKEY